MALLKVQCKQTIDAYKSRRFRASSNVFLLVRLQNLRCYAFLAYTASAEICCWYIKLGMLIVSGKQCHMRGGLQMLLEMFL